jgi:hypothetical protein
MHEMKHDWRDDIDSHRGPAPAWFVAVLAGALFWLAVVLVSR